MHRERLGQKDIQASLTAPAWALPVPVFFRMSPVLFQRSLPVLAIALIGEVLISSCTGPAPATAPDQAVLETIRSQKDEGSVQMDLATVRIRHTQALGSRVFYLVSFDGVMDQNLPMECMHVYEAMPAPRGGGWVIGSSGGGCASQGAEEMRGGGKGSVSGDIDNRSHSYFYSEISDPQITSAQVEWDDGQLQEAPVVNGIFLAVREGEHEYKEIRLLDSTGEVVDTLPAPVVAPGKQ